MLEASLSWTEWCMVATFFVGMIAWGLLMHKSATSSLEASFLADRKVPGFIASLSTVATNLNANDFIGGAGMVYTFGVIMTFSNPIGSLSLIVVSLILMQKLRRLRVFTLGEWLEKRYMPSIGIAYSVAWAGIWMLFNLGLYIYGGAFVLHSLVGWPLVPCIVAFSVIGCIFVLIGGFGAVVATDVLLVALMFFPFVFIAAAVWAEFGSPAHLAAVLPPEKAILWKSQTPFGSLPLMLVGIFIMSTSYWSTEAQVVQRPLAAKSPEDASICYLGASAWYAVLLPLLISFPALAALYYFPNLDNPDNAMPHLIRKFLPPGLYGITIVGLIASVFSSVDAQINSFCTTFVAHIYKRVLCPGKDHKHYLRVSTIAGIIFTLAAIGTALLFNTRWAQQIGMMLYAISILAVIMPPFAAIVIAGALLKFVNRRGAAFGLIIGALLAVTLIILEGLGYLSHIAQTALYFRAAVTFIVTFAITCLASVFFPDTKKEYEDSGADDGEPLIVWTPRLVRMVVVMLAAIVGMLIVWSWWF
jgi:SSS family solute:Na+ symporter